MPHFSELSNRIRKLIERPLGMEKGYVLDFSNKTIEVFFNEEFGIDFYTYSNQRNGTSKAKILRTILNDSSSAQSEKILLALWDHRKETARESMWFGTDQQDEKELEERYFSVISELDCDEHDNYHDVLETPKTPDETLGMLISSIQTEISVNGVSAAIDRVHTFCVNKFRGIMTANSFKFDHSEPLHSLVGKYAKQQLFSQKISGREAKLIKCSIPVFEELNTVRNEHSLAHDNPLIAEREARYLCDMVFAQLRLIKQIDRSF